MDGVYTAASVPVRWLGGWLADRFDRPKPVALAGYSLSAVARIGLLWTPGVVGVAGVLGVDRLGKGLRTAPRDALIASASAPESLARSFGVHRALDTTGAVLGPAIAFVALWAAPQDYLLVFVLSLAAAVVGVALLGLLVPDLRPAAAVRAAWPATAARAVEPAPAARAAGPAAAPTRARPPLPSLRLLADPGLARLVVAAGLLGLLTLGDAFVYLVLQDRSDLAAQWFPLLFVGTNLAYLALSVPFGRLADRLGRARVMVAGHLFLAAAYACAGGTSGSAVSLAACLLLLGAFYASTDGVLAAAAAGLVDVGIRGTAIATAQSVVALSRLGAAVGFGWLWLAVGRADAVLAMACALVVMTALTGWIVRSTVVAR